MIIILIPGHNKSLIGVSSDIEISSKKLNPLSNNIKSNHQLYPICIIRQDKEYLIDRGGGNHLLLDKKVAIIGCGSVGGYIAAELGKSGILNLTLIDKDILTEENVHRHFLGINSIGRENGEVTKVKALKKELDARLC